MSHTVAVLRPAARLRRSAAMLAAFVLLAAASACGDSATASNPIAGTYSATVFKVVPEGTTSTLDVKAAGGSITITIGENNATTGEVFVPASLNDGVDFHASMTGTAVVNGSTLTFTQTSDTFVRDLVWTVSGKTISVVDQVMSGDRYTITLSR